MSIQHIIEDINYHILQPIPPNKEETEAEPYTEPNTPYTEPNTPYTEPNTPYTEQYVVFVKGQFLYIKSEHTREMLVNAWNAITQLELWSYMKQETQSYMFSTDQEINRISRKMAELGYNGHSGFSFGWTMRQMQYIAIHGEEKYAEEEIGQR